MKKLLTAAIMSLLLLGMTVGSYAATDTLTTTVTTYVSQYWSWSLIDDTTYYRSMGSFTFETVDGSKESGWYYNSACTVWADGDPNDGKSDVGISVRTNAPFTLQIHKASDILNTKIGYYVNEAFNWDGENSLPVDTVYPGSGFAGTEAGDKWGELGTSATLIYDSGAVGYSDFSLGISFALVPGNLTATGSPHSTVITYTITNNL